MGAVRRGIKNVYRSQARAIVVILVLGLAVGASITLAQASAEIGTRVAEAAAVVGTLIEVRAAGATGMGVGVDALPEEFFERARSVPNVALVEKYLLQRMQDPTKSASISIVVGVEPGTTLRVASHGEVGTPRLIAGRLFTPGDRGRPVAIIGTLYAQQYGLKLGDRFTLRAAQVLLQDRPDPNVVLEDAEAEVVGIFDSGFAFGNNQVFLPLDFAQRIFKQEARVTHIFVTAASTQAVAQVEDDLFEVFGGRADVISGQATAGSWAQALGGIRANGLLGAGVAFAVGALVTLFTMVLVTRERTREIGVLKAIGASNGDVARQFVAESLALTFLGGAVGLLVFAATGTRLAAAILGIAGSSLNPATFMGGENPVSTLNVDLGVTWATVAYAFALVLLLGVVGSVYPAARAARMHPVEAIRHE
jgi:putative ABC transport system permease protein